MNKSGTITWVGLTIAAVGCNNPKPDDEVGGTETETGDGDGDTGEVPNNGVPIELVLAQFNATGKFLLLRFSEPVASVEGIDPSDFRISFASTSRYHYSGTVYSSSYYADPHYQLIYNYQYNGEYVPLIADLVANGNVATDIVLRFTDPLDPLACSNFAEIQAQTEELDAMPNFQARVGLFPHYSPGAVPIRSVDGDVLAPIGPEWVDYIWPAMVIEDFGWPGLDPRIEIPCNVVGDP